MEIVNESSSIQQLEETYFETLKKTALASKNISNATPFAKKKEHPSFEGFVIKKYPTKTHEFRDKTGALKSFTTTSVHFFVLNVNNVTSYVGRQYAKFFDAGVKDNNNVVQFPFLRFHVEKPDMKKFSKETHDLDQEIPAEFDIKNFSYVFISLKESEATPIKAGDRVTVYGLRASGYYPKKKAPSTNTTKKEGNDTTDPDAIQEYDTTEQLPTSTEKKNTVSIHATCVDKHEFPTWQLFERLVESDRFVNTFFGFYKEFFDSKTECVQLMPEQFFLKVQSSKVIEDDDLETNEIEYSRSKRELLRKTIRKWFKVKESIPYASFALYSDVTKSSLLIKMDPTDEKNEAKWSPKFPFTIQVDQEFPDIGEEKPNNFEVQSTAYESALEIFQIPNARQWSEVGQSVLGNKNCELILGLDLMLNKTTGAESHNLEAIPRICNVLFIFANIAKIYKKIGIPITKDSDVIVFTQRTEVPKEYQDCINVGGSSKVSTIHLKTKSEGVEYLVVTNLKDIEEEEWFPSLTPEKGTELMTLLNNPNQVDTLLKKKKGKKETQLTEVQDIACEIRTKTKESGFYYEVFAIQTIDEKIREKYKTRVENVALEIEKLSVGKSLYTLKKDFPSLFEKRPIGFVDSNPSTKVKAIEEKKKGQEDESMKPRMKSLPAPPTESLSSPPLKKTKIEESNTTDNNNNNDDNNSSQEIQEAQLSPKGTDEFKPKFLKKKSPKVVSSSSSNSSSSSDNE